ncbi:hypothetical protein BDZ45DRAFT_726627 [Acephala macrosclerotiorum]|nr:hypothetical protein BDZ45DRAFT_726627 [Acephala macrosclerotiorum]
MSQNHPTFTPEEEENFAQAALDRENLRRREYNHFGSFMSPRQKLWEEEQQRKRNAASEATTDPSTWTPQPPAGESSAYQTNYDNAEEYDQNAAQYSPSIYSEYNDNSVSAGVQETARLMDQSDYRSGNMTMTQLRNNRCNIEMHSSLIGWQGMKAVLDTGADENWISKEIVESLSLPINKGVVFRYKTVDGARLESSATVSARWAIQGRSTTDVAEFRAVTNGKAPFDVLFGKNLITSNQINFYDEERPHGVLVGQEETVEKQETAESSQASQQEIEALNEQRKKQKDRKKDKAMNSSSASGRSSRRSTGKSK